MIPPTSSYSGIGQTVGYWDPQVGQWTPMDGPTCPMCSRKGRTVGYGGQPDGTVDSHGHPLPPFLQILNDNTKDRKQKKKKQQKQVTKTFSE